MINSVTFWFILGIILLLSEFLIPGFTIFFFGVGALLTSILLIIITPIENIIWLQVIIFLTLSFTSLIFLRKKFKHSLRGELYKDRDDYTGEKCKVVETVKHDQPGRILFHGTTWTAYSDEGVIKKNHMATIIGKKVDDPMIFIIKN